MPGIGLAPMVGIDFCFEVSDDPGGDFKVSARGAISPKGQVKEAPWTACT